MTEKRERDERTIKDPKRIVAMLFKESGAIAPVDFGRFGKRAGEIIAQAARPQLKAGARRQH